MYKESKLAKTIKRISSIGIFLLPVLTFLYFWWLQNTRLFIFLKNYKAIFYISDLALWIGFLFTLAALMAQKRFILGVALFLILTPCLSISSLFLIEEGPTLFKSLPSRLDSAQLGSNMYYLTSGKGEWSLYYLGLYKCRSLNLSCEEVHFGDIDHSGGHLVADISNEEINVVNGAGGLIYTYGDHPRHYDPYSRTQLGNHLYYLSEECTDKLIASQSNDYTCNLIAYTLDECTLNNTPCRQIPFKFEIKHEV